MERVQNEYILEKYEPMTKKYWQRNKKPNINLLDCPFATDRQLEDQKYLIQQNKNPRGLEPGKNDKPRSIKIAAKIGVGSSVNTKAKVVNKIVREASGIHNYTLVPPIVGKLKEKLEIDPDTHPLMKPYREQSNTNPIMCSFGHRPKSASRTFNPGTMKIRLKKNEIAESAPNGRNGFGLPPSVLSKLLHAPKIYHPGEEFDDPKSNSLYDPHDLFLPNEDIFNSKKSKKDNDAFLQSNSLKVGEHAWSTTLSNGEQDHDQDQDQNENQNNSPKKSPKKHSSKKSTLNKEIIQYEIEKGWNNHFHVIERLSNEKFELRKSGIAELKLLPLKERLTRFAAISVRDSVPQPFCQEKKITDSFLINGISNDPTELYRLSTNSLQHKPLNTIIPYNRTENPYFDAEVEADLKFIQSEYHKKEERKLKKLKKKMLKTALESIPHIEYHPDDAVIEMAHIDELKDNNSNDDNNNNLSGDEDNLNLNINLEDSIVENSKEQKKNSKSPKENNIIQINIEEKKKKKTKKIIEEKQSKEYVFDIKDIEKEDRSDSKKKKKEEEKYKKEEVKLKKITNNDRINEKIHKFENIYKLTLHSLDEVEGTKYQPKKITKNKTQSEEKDIVPPVQDESDVIYTHVMGSFEDYFKHEKEKELLQLQWKKEREEREEKERIKLLQFQKEMERKREGDDEYDNNEGDEGDGGDGEGGEYEQQQQQPKDLIGDSNGEEGDEEDEEKYDDNELFQSSYAEQLEGQRSVNSSNIYDESEGEEK
mmetsp:Transcript_18953/g.19692  ORF Transcript_18953/g.19692 Transcript_18953/m.19692 type:complete len:762 (-) Transcript_18953:46-2331(-)